MCQVIDYYHVQCQHTFRYRLVNRCPTGFSLEVGCCKANENQVIDKRPLYCLRRCTECRCLRSKVIHEIYELCKEEARSEVEKEEWSEQTMKNAIERVRDEGANEENTFFTALAEVEDREEPAGTMDGPCDFDSGDDSGFEEHRQNLSDDDESHATQDDSGSEDGHSVSSAVVGSGDEISGDESSEPEAEALPHTGFLGSPLVGRGHGFEEKADISSDGEDSYDFPNPDSMEICNSSDSNELHIQSQAGIDNEDACDSDNADWMDICDEGAPKDDDYHISAAACNNDHRNSKADIEDTCGELEIGLANPHDDLDGYEADTEDDVSNVGFEVNYDGSEADIEDNCLEDAFDSSMQAKVGNMFRLDNLQRQMCRLLMAVEVCMLVSMFV